MSFIDVLLGAEVALLVFIGLPLSVRGTIRLIEAIRISTANDRLARAITYYLILVTLTAIYLLLITVARYLTGNSTPDWLRPITGAMLLMVLCGPWWIERAVRSTGPRERDRSEQHDEVAR